MEEAEEERRDKGGEIGGEPLIMVLTLLSDSYTESAGTAGGEDEREEVGGEREGGLEEDGV